VSPSRLPPRWLRRVLQPLLLAGLAAATTLLPVLVVAAAAASHWLPGRLRALRLLCFALVWLALECAALVAALVLWVATGLGSRLDAPRSVHAHYTVLRWVLAVAVGVGRRLFRLELRTEGVSWTPLDDGLPGSTNAMVVLSRHAGPGDSVLLVHTLMDRDHLRRPRIVLKDLLRLDPLLDVYLGRLPAVFVDSDPSAGAGAAVADGIGRLAAGMGEEDALLVFPEGGNFTPARRRRIIDRLRGKGLEQRARAAESLQHLLPPRPAGVVAALQAAPHADVVLVAHTGLEHLVSLRDLWRELPMDKVLHLRWWFVPAAEVPREREAATAWLNEWWGRIDGWLAERAVPAGGRP